MSAVASQSGDEGWHMRYGVSTGELGVQAAALRADSTTTTAAVAGLREAAQSAGTWSVGRAERATTAFFDLLLTAAADGGVGLRELGNRLGAAAGEYDTVEDRLLSGP